MNKKAIINYAGIEFILNGVLTENEESYSFQSEIITLQMNTWYVLDMDITLKNNKYFVQWSVNGDVKAELQLTFGEEIEFAPILSLENLKFLGDHISNNDYEVKFDRLEITHYK